VFRSNAGAVRRSLASCLALAAVIAVGIFPPPAAAAEPALGSVTIVQRVPSGVSRAFPYSANVPELMSNFYLDIDPTTYAPMSITSNYVTPGPYTVSQDEPEAGWVVSDIECNDPGGNTTTDLSNRAAHIQMDAGEEITCSFTNTEVYGEVVVRLDTIPDDPTSFQFAADWSGSFSLADDGNEVDDGTWNTMTSSGIIPGEYDLSQQVAAGYDLSIECDDPDGGTDTYATHATLDIDGNETIVCTFTNRPTAPPAPTTGDVTINLDTVPNNPVDVAFGGGFGGFSLDDDGDATLSNSTTFSHVAPGTKVVTATVPTGYVLSDLTCTDPDGGTTVTKATVTMTIDVDAAEAVNCVLTIARIQNQLNISLDTVPNDPVDVAFGLGANQSFTLDDDAAAPYTNGAEYNNIALGSWPVVAHLPSGWRLKDLTCSDPDGGTTLDKPNAKATVDLDNNEVVNCTFTIEAIPQTPPPPPPPPTTLKCNGKDVTIAGGPGATTIRGTQGDDVIVDLDGANRIDGRGGNDTICTGPGSDVIDGGAGDDWIDAGDGANKVDAGVGNDTVRTGSGNDSVVGDNGNDTIDAGDGSNVVSGDNGNDTIVTGSGNDQVDGGKSFDTCRPGAGTNTVRNCEA
jgi:Ca2+-binding RTX toxin-like protein